MEYMQQSCQELSDSLNSMTSSTCIDPHYGSKVRNKIDQGHRIIALASELREKVRADAPLECVFISLNLFLILKFGLRFRNMTL
jgi:hypothetical protein